MMIIIYICISIQDNKISHLTKIAFKKHAFIYILKYIVSNKEYMCVYILIFRLFKLKIILILYLLNVD